MRKLNIYILIGVLIISGALFLCIYIFNIYEITYSVNPSSLFADNESTLTITCTPINAFGWKVPFRNAHADFNIKEGSKFIDVVLEDKRKGIFRLKAKNETGVVVIYIKSKYSLLPSSIEIHIYPPKALELQDYNSELSG